MTPSPAKHGGSRRRSGVLAAIVSMLILLQVAMAPVAAIASPAVPDASNPRQLESFLDDAMTRQLKELSVPGAAVAVVKHGEVVFTKGWGYADVERKVPMDAERTLIRPGSASKPFVWTAVMQLAEQGRLDLDADINDYLDLDIPATFSEPVTMHHLLTHSAGFEAVEDDLFILDERRVPSLEEYLNKHKPARVFRPGTVPCYSNYGTALAAYTVQRITGEPFYEYVENHIFSPLGMSRTTLRQPVPEHLDGDLAQGYGGRTEFVRGDFEYVGPYPAGSASMTANDMAKFMIAHMTDGNESGAKILKPETMELMHRQQFTPDSRLSKMAYGFAEMRSNGKRLLWHGGSTFLHSSGLYLLPDESLGIFVAYNGRGGAAGSTALVEAFMDEFYPAGGLARLQPSPASQDRNSRYAGEYHSSRSQFTGGGKFVRLLSATQVTAPSDGRLLVTVEGASVPYIEVEDGIYRHENRDEHLVFKNDPDGMMWVHSDGAPSHPTFFATSAFRVPWYEASSLTALVLLATAVTFLLSLLGWGVSALVRTRREPHSKAQRVSRWIAVSFGALYWTFLIALATALASVDPAYGVPRAFLGEEPWFLGPAIWIPVAMAVLAVAMLAASVNSVKSEVWGASRWGAARKVHYALLAVLAVAASATLFFWNLNALTG